jgi:hypothetical protein
VSYGWNYGFYATGGTTTIVDAQVHNNDDGIGVNDTDVSLTVSSSSIFNNTSYGALNQTGPTSTMSNNFWGGWTPIDDGKNPGPYHISTNASGAGNRVSDSVNYSSYVGAYLFNPSATSTSPSAVNDFGLLVGIAIQYTSSSDAAITKWRNATSGLISFSTTTVTSTADLVIKDYSQSCVCASEAGCTIGYWDPNTSPPSINLNQYAINDCGFNPTETTKTVMHEIGHSMGLAHVTSTGNIMKQGQIAQDYLGPLDYFNYNFRWSDWWAELWSNLL